MKDPVLLRVSSLLHAETAISAFAAARTDAAGTVTVLLPAAEVMQARLEMPRLPSSKLRDALAYALEERFITDAESQHIALGSNVSRAANKIEVTSEIIERSRLETLLATLSAHGLTAAAIHVDAACINSRPADVLLWLEASDAHWITPDGRRTTLPADDLAQGLAWLDLGPTSRTLGLRVYAAPDLLDKRSDDFEMLRPSFSQLQLHPVADVLAWLQHELTTSEPVNLLQGEFTPRRSNSELASRWRLPALLAASVVSVNFLATTLAWQQQSRAAEAIEARIFATARDVLPPGATARNAVALLERQFGATTTTDSSVTDLLAMLEQASASSPELKLDRLELESGTLRLYLADDGTGGDIQVLEFRDGRQAR